VPTSASAWSGREAQRKRFTGKRGGPASTLPLVCNADMGPAEVREYCRLDEAAKNLPLGPAVCLAGVRSAPQGGTPQSFLA